MSARRAAPFVVSALLLIVGCNGVSLNTYVAADSGEGCDVAPNITCDPVAPSSASCVAQAGASGLSALLPLDAGFPTGCQAYFRGKDCSSRGFCSCDGQDDAGLPAHWNCHDTNPDGGS